MTDRSRSQASEDDVTVVQFGRDGTGGRTPVSSVYNPSAIDEWSGSVEARPYEPLDVWLQWHVADQVYAKVADPGDQCYLDRADRELITWWNEPHELRLCGI